MKMLQETVTVKPPLDKDSLDDTVAKARAAFCEMRFFGGHNKELPKDGQQIQEVVDKIFSEVDLWQQVLEKVDIISSFLDKIGKVSAF